MPANADDIFGEYYEPVTGQEIFLAQETGAHIKGFISVAEWQAHQLAEARRPINRLRRLFSRLGDFATDHLYVTAGLLGGALGYLSWYL